MSNMAKDTIDDVDDDLFISKKPQRYIFAEKKANDIQERTSKMMLNTRSLVQESERVGQSTLEQLSSQRETLDRVENDLDNINSMTRSTQKHLNNMKSFFGGIKSLFSSSNQSTPASVVPPNTKPGIPRSATIATMPSNSTTSLPIASETRVQGSGLALNAAATTSSLQHNINRNLEEPADEFEANLSEIGFGLGRLKEMAMKLGGEIGDQNEMLDRITEKSERAGDSIKHQNRQMQQLLKKS